MDGMRRGCWVGGNGVKEGGAGGMAIAGKHGPGIEFRLQFTENFISIKKNRYSSVHER